MTNSGNQAGRLRAAYEKVIGIAAQPLDRELADRGASRGKNGLLWFTPEEAAVAQALGCIIIPSDDEAPGFDEIEVLGPPGIEGLDRIVAGDPARQLIYAHGLLSFDIWARRRQGCGFAEMAKSDQIALFRAAQHVRDGWANGSLLRRIAARLRSLLGIRRGHYFAAQLFPLITNDCFQVFYTSRVSWVWLEYDGPPMDEGYPLLAARR